MHTDNGFLRLDGCIYIPEANDLQLQILQYNHNHVVSGTSGKIRQCLWFVKITFGQTSKPSSLTSASHAPHVCTPNLNITSPMAFSSSYQSPSSPGTPYPWISHQENGLRLSWAGETSKNIISLTLSIYILISSYKTFQIYFNSFNESTIILLLFQDIKDYILV